MQTELTTTLADLRKANACEDRYRHLASCLGDDYGDTTPIPISLILSHNGLEDALWVLQAVPTEQVGKRDRIARLFACDCAEHVLSHYEAIFPEDGSIRACIETARRYALGDASDDELAAAWTAACRVAEIATWSGAKSAASAAWSAAEIATWSAESAAWSAKNAAWTATNATLSAAARSAEKDWQTSRLRELLEGKECDEQVPDLYG